MLNIIKFVFFSDKITQKNVDTLKNSSLKVDVLTMQEVEDKGKISPQIEDYERPNKDDLAIIMYTSGSTGTPKGYFKVIYYNFLS